MLLTLASLRGSPGVTTTAIVTALVAAARGWGTTLVEADPDGGVLRHLLTELDGDRNLLSFAVAARTEDAAVALDGHAQPLDENSTARVLLAPPTGPQVAKAVVMLDGAVRAAADDPSRLVIVDCGRLSNISASLHAGGDRRWLLTRPDAASVLSLRDLLDTYPAAAARQQIMLVGDRPYGPADLAEVAMNVGGVIADDPRTAEAVLARAPVRRFGRTALVRSVSALMPTAPDVEPASSHATSAADTTTVPPDADTADGGDGGDGDGGDWETMWTPPESTGDTTAAAAGDPR